MQRWYSESWPRDRPGSWCSTCTPGPHLIKSCDCSVLITSPPIDHKFAVSYMLWPWLQLISIVNKLWLIATVYKTGLWSITDLWGGILWTVRRCSSCSPLEILSSCEFRAPSKSVFIFLPFFIQSQTQEQSAARFKGSKFTLESCVTAKTKDIPWRRLGTCSVKVPWRLYVSLSLSPSKGIHRCQHFKKEWTLYIYFHI